MDKKNNNIFHLKKTLLSNLFFLLIITYALYKGCISDNHRNDLKHKGIHTKAIITSIRKYGTKGDFENIYQFTWKGNFYEGRCLESGHELYESIEIVFLPDDPKINKTKRDVFQ